MFQNRYITLVIGSLYICKLFLKRELIMVHLQCISEECWCGGRRQSGKGEGCRDFLMLSRRAAVLYCVA